MPNLYSAANRPVLSGRRRRSAKLSESSGVEALESRTHLSVSQDVNGFTVVAPAADSRIIYVSSSQGNDHNSGRSADSPVKTLADALGQVRDHSADQVLLKRGDVWTGETLGGWYKSGRSEQEPILIGAYGTGERPLLKTGSVSAFDASSGSFVQHVAIIGLQLSAHTRLPGSSFTSTAGNPGIRVVSKTNDFLVEDCFIQGYRDNLMMQDFNGPLTNIKVRRNVVVDAYGVNGTHAQGMYGEGINGLLLEENVFDHNGWLAGAPGATPTGFNHDVYLRAHNDNITVRGNIFANASSHGLQARAGGKIENNLFLDNPIGMSFGLVNGSPGTPGGVTGLVNGNVFIGGDNKSIGGVLRGWALEVGNTKPGGGSAVSNNIFSGNGDGQMPAMLLTVGTNLENRNETVGINDLTIANNTVYKWADGIRLSSSLAPGQTGPDGINDISIHDNDFQVITDTIILHDMPFRADTETWANNRYDGGPDNKPDITLGYNGVAWDRWRSDREPTGKSQKVHYPAADRDAGSYNAALGGDDTTAAFLAEARRMSSQNWRPQYTAAPVVGYMQEGFAKTATVVVAPPPAPAPGPQPEPPAPAPQPEPPQGGNPGDLPHPQPVNTEPPPAPTPPVATSDLPKQVDVVAGDAALTFNVTYVDADAAIDLATLDAGDVRVVGRRGFDQPATLVSVQPADGAGATVVATYAVTTADGGAWERNDRGTYTVMTNAEQVRDAAGVAVEPAELVQFKLNVAKPPRVAEPPVDKAPTVRKLKFAGRGVASVTATFSEDVSASIDAGDLYLLGEDGTRAVDPSLMSVTYDAEKNTATWTFAGLPDGALPKGRYRVVLAGWGITDSVGQALDGNKDGTAGDDYAPAKTFKV